MITTLAWYGYEMPKKQNFELIKQIGFDGVLVWWNDEFGDRDFRNNPKLARDAGLFVENMHTPFDKINDLWLDNLNGNDLLEYFLDMVKDCADYQIPTMVMHLSYGKTPPPFNELGLERVKRIIGEAEKHNVNVAFENLRLINYLEYVLNNIDSPRAGFCYDSGHHNLYFSHVDLLEKYGSRLMSLHLHDNHGAADHHLLPFDGNIDWPATMKNIKQTGYTGPLAMEAENKGYENLSPEEYLRQLYERAKKLEILIQRGQYQ